MSTYASVTSQNIVIRNYVNNKYEQNESVNEEEDGETNNNDEESSVVVDLPNEIYYSDDEDEFKYGVKDRKKSINKNKIKGKGSWSSRNRHQVGREVFKSHCERKDTIRLKKQRYDKIRKVSA